ncbi:hypothetical protein [Halolamina salina]|uniref:Uncharacterized protein n=1 Tax=Halolamina salina TaxID=1220023 RepID=A0ABD6BA76_9EURY
MGSLPTTKGGNVVLKELALPDSVEPGEMAEAQIRVKNRAIVINPLDGDRCNNPVAGYKMRAGLTLPSGETVYTNEKCVAGDFSNHTWAKTFEVPDDGGDYTVEAWVEMTGSGKTTDTLEQSLSITSTPPETPDDGGSDDNDGGNGLPWLPSGGSTPDPSDPLNIGGQMDKLLLVVGLIAVAWAADSGAEVIS